MRERPVEPSDTERAEWPDTTREYVECLEGRVDDLEQAILDAQQGLLRSATPFDAACARLRDAVPSEPDVEGQPDPTNWLTCQGNKMPPELAPAQIVEFETFFPTGIVEIYRWEEVMRRADKVEWYQGLHYRPALDADGLFMVSREGLNPETRFVATDEDGTVFQFSKKPRHEVSDQGCNIWADMNDGGGPASPAPDTHRIPGDWRDSLASVWDGEG